MLLLFGQARFLFAFFFFFGSFVFGVQRAFWTVLVGSPKAMKISKTNKKLRKYGKYLVVK
jgi:hypothetical protein